MKSAKIKISGTRLSVFVDSLEFQKHLRSLIRTNPRRIKLLGLLDYKINNMEKTVIVKSLYEQFNQEEFTFNNMKIKQSDIKWGFPVRLFLYYLLFKAKLVK